MDMSVAVYQLLTFCSPFPYDAFNAAKAYGQVTDEGGVRLTEALEKRTFD